MPSFDSDRSMVKEPKITTEQIQLDPFQEPSAPAGASPTRIAHHLHGWPEHPQSLRLDWIAESLQDIYDIALVIAPVCLIVKAALCIIAAQRDYHENHYGINIGYASSLSKNLVEVNKQLATIFTIFFLTIMSTLFKRLALFKAERGASLADLELLQASVSPTSTVKVLWSLRRFTLFSFAIASVWVWYYIGSQAAVQEFKLRDTFQNSEHMIAILSPDALSPFEDGTWDSYTPIWRADMTSMFHVYSQKSEGETTGEVSSDVAGDALPLVVTDDMKNQTDLRGWIGASQSSKFQIAQSVGAHLYVNDKVDTAQPGFNTSWHSTQMIGQYQFNASYLYVQCSNLTFGTSAAPEGLTQYMSMAFNMTNTTTGGLRTFDFWNEYNSSHAFTASCSVSQLNEELSVTCGASSCKVNHLRSRPGFQNPSPKTPFDDDAHAKTFFDNLLFVCGKPQSPTDKSTFDGDNGLTLLRGKLDSGAIPTTSTSIADALSSFELSLSGSITKYFNTLIEASKHLKYQHEFDVQELGSLNRNITIDTSNPAWDILSMYGAAYEPNYAASVPWVAVDIVSCSVLFFAAIWAFWLRKHTEAPDIFGYVSSMTRDNPMLDVPGGSALGGMERSKLMQNVRVKICEIQPDEGSHGRIGMTYVVDQHDTAKTLERGRLYV